MSRFPKFALAALVAAGLAAPALADGYGLGREALPEEVAAWDIDVRPDGQGLPEGSGDVLTGEEIFAEQCAYCHGDFGEGVDRWPVLSGGHDTLADDRPVKTIGSYWPYLSTVYDYINRAMPFGYAQSLQPDDVYAITAYLLYMNDVVDDDEFVLSRENFTEVRLPNEQNFFADPRPDIPNVADTAPCMSDCKESAEITMRARILDVTPEADDDATAGISVE
ncbi:MAG: cytochrome c [Pseudomonadota bacterium]